MKKSITIKPPTIKIFESQDDLILKTIRDEKQVVITQLVEKTKLSRESLRIKLLKLTNEGILSKKSLTVKIGDDQPRKMLVFEVSK